MIDENFEQLFNGENGISLQIFNSITEGVVVADANLEFKFFNKAAEKILGIGMQQMDPGQWSNVYGCFYVDRVTPFPSEQLPLTQTIRTGKVSRETVFIKNHTNPEGLYLDISGSPLMDTDHSIRGGIVIFKDITENTRSEMASRESEQRLNAQFKGFPIPTYVWKKVAEDFILVDYNNAAGEFTEGAIKKLMGIPLSKLYPDPLDPICVDITASFNDKKIINKQMSYELQTSGKKKELNVHYVYIQPDLVVVHTEDITERKKTEKHLQKISRAVEQTADAVLITNEEGIIEYVNPAFEDITGYKEEETIGKTPRILKSGNHDPDFYKNLWRTLLDGNPYKDEMINRRKNGDDFWLQNTITPIKDSNEKIVNFVSVIKDITEIKAKKEMEIRLQIAKEIQQRFYDSDVNIPGYDIAVKNFPADETGGDYFDVIPTADGNLWLTTADVSSHGIGPALIMSGTRAYLRAFLETTSDPAEVLGKLNNMLYNDLDTFNYVTMLLVQINPHKKEMVYSGAGHVPGFLFNHDGEVEQVLDSTGIPLGYKKNQPYENTKIAGITPGNMVALLTDGIIEVQNKNEDEFGCEKILHLIKSFRNEPSEDIINHIYREVCGFNEDCKFEDDITALICKLKDFNKQ